jgi:hypothetical protein
VPFFGGKEAFYDHGGYQQHWVAAFFSSDGFFEVAKCSRTFVLLINCIDTYNKIYNIKN